MAGETERMFVGNRFRGYYSKNRIYADINDRKQRGSLRMLTLGDVNILRARMDGIARAFKDLPDKLEPFNVSYPEKDGKLVGLTYEDTVELRDLAGRLTDILVPSIS